jgi:hypothetical protein
MHANFELYLMIFLNKIDRRIEKESLKDYINKKREMFLVQVCEVLIF